MEILIILYRNRLAILTSIFMFFIRKFYKVRQLPIILCVLFVFLYMAVTGYSPSVVRSGMMMLICCLGLSLSREPYSLNSLGLAAIILTIANPYAVGDVGLIL